MTTNDPVRIAPCLWFDDQAEEAATFYTRLFPDSRITAVSREDPTRLAAGPAAP